MSLTPAERRLVEILARIAYRRLREKQALADVAARGDRDRIRARVVARRR